MKLNLSSKSVITIGLITLLGAIQGVNMTKTAQAQTDPNAGAVCTAAYFDNPGYMYQAATQQQQEAIEKYEQNPDRLRKIERMMAEITTFSAPLDSPMGYAAKTVDGKPITIPAKIEEEIQKLVLVDPSQNSRQRVAELNQKYGQYATFGQNIILLPSPEQTQEYDKYVYEYLAYIKSMLTPEEQKAQRDQAIAAPISDGYCQPGALYKPGRATFSIDTGTRPDLDQRVREDKTGTTLFQ